MMASDDKWSTEKQVEAALTSLEETSHELAASSATQPSFSAQQSLRLHGGTASRYSNVPSGATIPADSSNSPASNPRHNANFEQITSMDVERILPNFPESSAPREIGPGYSRRYISESVERWRNSKRRRLWCFVVLGLVGLIVLISIIVAIAQVSSSEETTKFIDVLVDFQPPCADLPAICNPILGVSIGWLRYDTGIALMLNSFGKAYNQKQLESSTNNTFSFDYVSGPLYYAVNIKSNNTKPANTTGKKIKYDQAWSPADSFEVQRVELIREATIGDGNPQPFISLFRPPADPTKNYDPKCVSMATSPLGIVMWRSMATALGWPDKPVGWNTLLQLAQNTSGWASVSEKLRDFGTLKLGMGHYDFSTSGRLALFSQLYAFAGNVTELTAENMMTPEVAANIRALYSAIVRYDSDDSLLMDMMTRKIGSVYGQNYLHGVITYEYNAIKYNKEKKGDFPNGDSLVFILPSEGTYWSDFPFCILDNLVTTPYLSALQTEVSKFTEYIRSSTIQNDLVLKAGFRPITLTSSDDISKLPDSPFTDANGIIPSISTAQSRQLPRRISNIIRSNATQIWQDQKRRGVACLVLDLDRLVNAVNIHVAEALKSWMLRVNDNTDMYVVQVNGSYVSTWPPGSPNNYTLGSVVRDNTTANLYLDLFKDRIVDHNHTSGNSGNISLGTRVLQGIKRCTTILTDVRNSDLELTPKVLRSYHLPIITEGRDEELLKLNENSFVDEILSTAGASNIVYYPNWITYQDIADKMPKLRPMFKALADRTYGYAIEADDTFELFTTIELATRMF